MPIDPLQTASVAVNPSPQAPSGSRGLVREGDAGAGAPADQVRLTPRVDRHFEQKQVEKERVNVLAGSVRRSDRALQLYGQKVDQMKAPLNAIVKNFPPFAHDDQSRVKLMREYASLRKEIDQLTFPPPPEIVEARRALTLPQALDPGASDSQIADHLAKLDATSAELGRQRAGLASDTAAFLGDGRFLGLFSAPSGVETAPPGEVSGESAAAQKSAQVGQQFAHSVSHGVTSDRSDFLKGLG